MPPERRRKQNAPDRLKLCRQYRFVILDPTCPPAAKERFSRSPGTVAPELVTGPMDSPIMRGSKSMPNANIFMPAELFRLPQATSEQRHCPARRRPTVEPRCELEPEHRLWKVCMEADSSNFGTMEGIAFLFFGALAISATVSSFSELFHLLVSGSVEHVVQALLPR
jgi:hypothetical protein